ncbi:TPA: hypothetical protein ACKP0L_003823 [Pseudomonas putida]
MRGKPFFARRVEVGQGDPRIWPPGESVVLASDYAALREETEALRADAERYRYLRDGLALRFKRPGACVTTSAADTDSAIDAARLQAVPA